MRDRWRGLAAFGLGVLGFGYVILLDTVVSPALPASGQGDVMLWGGALIAAIVGSLAFARVRADAKRLATGGALAAAGFLVAFVAFQAMVLFTMSTMASQQLYVERTDEAPVATLDANATYENAPELAQALDELVQEDLSRVLVASDEATVQRAQDHLVEATGDYVDPFSWRGTTVRAAIVAS